MNGRTDGRMDGRMVGRTDGLMDRGEGTLWVNIATKVRISLIILTIS